MGSGGGKPYPVSDAQHDAVASLYRGVDNAVKNNFVDASGNIVAPLPTITPATQYNTNAWLNQYNQGMSPRWLDTAYAPYSDIVNGNFAGPQNSVGYGMLANIAGSPTMPSWLAAQSNDRVSAPNVPTYNGPYATPPSYNAVTGGTRGRSGNIAYGWQQSGMPSRAEALGEAGRLAGGAVNSAARLGYGALTSGIDTVGSAVQGAGNAIGSAANSAAGVLGSAANSLMGNIGNALNGGANTINTVANDVLGAVPKTLNSAMSGAAKGVMPGITAGALAGTIPAVGTALTGIGLPAAIPVGLASAGLGALAGAGLGAAAGAAPAALNSATRTAGDLVNGVTGTVSSALRPPTIALTPKSSGGPAGAPYSGPKRAKVSNVPTNPVFGRVDPVASGEMVGRNPVYGYLGSTAAGANVYSNPTFQNRAMQTIANGGLLSDSGYLGSITSDAALDPMNNPYYKDQVTNLEQNAVADASAKSAAAGRRGSGLAAGVAAKQAQEATTSALNQQYQANQARQLAGKQLALQSTQQAANLNDQAYNAGKEQQIAANQAVNSAYQGEMGDWLRAADQERTAYDAAAARQLQASQYATQADIDRAHTQLQAMALGPQLQGSQNQSASSAVEAANQYYNYLNNLNNQAASQYGWLAQTAGGVPGIQMTGSPAQPGLLPTLGSTAALLGTGYNAIWGKQPATAQPTIDPYTMMLYSGLGLMD